MSLSLKKILRPSIMTPSYQQRRSPRPLRFTDNFFKNPAQIPGDEYEQIVDPDDQRPAPLNNAGSEARVLDLSGLTQRKLALFCSYNKIPLKGDVLHALREPDSMALQSKGAKEVERQLAKFGARHQLQRELVLAKTIMNGLVYVGVDGSILESSTNAVVTASFGISADHQDQLDGIIADSWDDPSADLLQQADDIREQAEAENLPTPTEAIAHPSMKANLRNNTDFQTWAASFSMGTDEILRGNLIEGFAGFNWHFWGGQYEAADGTMTNFVPEGRVTFCPSFDDPVYQPVIGSTLVPNSVDVKPGWQQALNEVEEVFGEYSYAKLVDDPLALWIYMGNKYALHFGDPNCLWQAEVVFE